MSRIRIGILIVALLIFGISAETAAQGLLGERYVLVTGGASFTTDDSSPLFEAEVNVPVRSTLDLFAGYAYSETNNRNAYALGGGMVLHAPFSERTEGYIGLFAGTLYDNDHNLSWSLTGGFEIALGENSALRPSISYAAVVTDKNVDDSDNIALWLEYNYWLAGRYLLYAASSFSPDPQDLGVLVGVGVSF